MKIAQVKTIPISTIDIPENERGEINAEPPRIKRILEIFDPRIFPRASCPLPFSAATTQVASSGIDVPAAMTVIAMNLSETPKIFAISVAALTKIFPPQISPASPPRIIIDETDIE